MIAVATTLVVSLMLPKQYTATASVVIDFKPDPVTAVMFGGMASPAFMATQVDVIQSDRIALRVVKNLRLAENPQIRQQWSEETNGQGSIETWLADSFKKRMDVLPSKESSVITISYKAPDPRFAAALANAFVQAYVETSLELRVDPAKVYSSFFDTRAKEARDALEKAQTRLSEYQRSNSIIASDERLDVENARLNELSSQLVAIQALAAESSSRQTQANSAVGDRMQEVLNNPLIAGIKSDMSRGEARLQELNTKLGDSHPQVVEAKANLAELKARLEIETRKVTGGVTISNTINRQREADVRAALEAQRAKLLRLKSTRDEGMVLAKDVDNAQRAYDAVTLRLNQTSLESLTTQSNVNVLTQAVPPLEPSSPKVVLNTLLSFFVGLLLAMGLAMLLETRDRRVRSVEDIHATLHLPVLGVLPKPGSKRLLRKADSEMQRRLMAPLKPVKEA